MFDFQFALKTLGFSLKDGASGLIYIKQYTNCNNYEITVDVNEEDYKKSKIDFGKDIDDNVGRATTQNMHQRETFVVLECVDRLLSNGYSPKEIVLEKDYPSGRKEKGQFLDILVTKEGLPFYMIECKTYGDKYNKELRNLKDDGGQLLTYYTNDRAVKAICLYSSTVKDEKIEAEYKIIDTSEFNGSDKKDLYNSWDKNFSNIPLFKEPYGLNSKGITKDDLKPIVEDRKLYNGFARILRKYAVSDLTNAYNKLFNLFLCKIVDEDKLYSNPSYDIQFQWKKEDTSYDVLDRLSNLYNEGIDKYLKISVTDYSKSKFLEDIKTLSNGNKELGAELLKEFNELRFIKNNEFAFIEVFNMETFKQNSLILREVVKLFERVKIKYSDKDQFLGDFFERLLNIGIKQTEGQFFTPIPIANFIVNSIPFEKMIEDKVNNDDEKFLPYMIDYACGAGHFITEFMHRIEPILNTYKQSDFKTKLQIQNYKQWAQNQYAWAKEFVYGIEKDYRLTKTSKIACFLNGDGDANIITGNGLDSFDSDIFENTILYENLKGDDVYAKDNNVFDCVIANPPYSVQEFKDTLKKSNEEPYGNKNFELFKSLGDSSDDIECLFMERAKQLLKEDGYAAIVLANTFLTNSGIHQKTRKMILENFKIKGIVELGSGAFMATGTNTIVLFMQKRKIGELENIKNVLNGFKTSFQDINFNGKTKFISQFLKDTYEDLDFENYISLFKNNPTDEFKVSDLYEEYYDNVISKLENKISKTKKEAEKTKLQTKLQEYKTTIPDLSDLITTELNKIYLYLLNDGINTVVISAGDSKDEVADFLGYKFSKRKGDEGLKELTDKAIKELETYTNRETINSKLYNPNLVLDPNKVNYYIYNNLLKGELSEQDLELMHKKVQKMKYYALNDLFEYDTLEFDETIGMESKKKRKISSPYPLKRLKDVVDFISGVTYPKSAEVKQITKNKILPSDNISLDNELNIKKVIYLDQKLMLDDNKKLKKGDIYITMSNGSLNHIGKQIYIEEDLPYYCGGFMNIMRKKTDDVLPKYIHYILSSSIIKNAIEHIAKGSNINNLSSKLKYIKIPIPLDISIQNKLISDLDELNRYKEKLVEDIKNIEVSIKYIFHNLSTVKKISLGKIVDVVCGQSPESTYYNDEKDGLEFYQGMINFGYKFINHSGIYTTKTTKESIKDDVLMSVRAPAGPVNINPFEKICIGRGLAALRVKKEYANIISQDYVYLYLKYNQDLVLKGSKKGVGFKSINSPKIKKIEFKYPTDENELINLNKALEKKETEIKILQDEIKKIPAKKQAILDKYLK